MTTAPSNLVNFLVALIINPAATERLRQCASRLSCALNITLMAMLNATVYSTPGVPDGGFFEAFYLLTYILLPVTTQW